LTLAINNELLGANLVIISAGALCQFLHDGRPEVAAHDEVDDRVEDGVDEGQEEEANSSPGRSDQIVVLNSNRNSTPRAPPPCRLLRI